MRLWHLDLLPYLPEKQFKGQLRELVAIMHDWRDKGETNHTLINRVMDYPKSDLTVYFLKYEVQYHKRYGKWLPKHWAEFHEFGKEDKGDKKPFYDGWLNNKQYLRVCMANLYEKWKFGKGKSKINDQEWLTLKDGYYKITGEEYAL